MSFRIGSFKACAMLAVGLATATFATSLGSAAANAANKPHHRIHRERVVYATHRWHPGVQSATLPYGPKYDFLTHVPADAIREPGYTYVPGVGILGESCDLPTSACPNRYRDIE